MLDINFGELCGVSLNEGWCLIPDPMGRCRQQKWWKNNRKEGYFFPSYDDDAFWKTIVPASYNIIHPNLEFYEGDVIYINHFSIRKPLENERALLCFGAVNDNCEVFLNGIYLGSHRGGYQQFVFDITNQIKEENRLLLICNSIRTKESVPGMMHDWFHYGGIIRDVSIFIRSNVFVRDAGIALKLNGNEADIELSVLLEGDRRKTKEVSYSLLDVSSNRTILNGKLAAQINVWNHFKASISLDKLRLWSPDDPFLYKFEIRTDDDVWYDMIGLREIRTEGRDILLNSKPIILKGAAAWASDKSGLFSVGKETAEKVVMALKGVNANFARAGHCPPGKNFVKECDRKGILLWLETPAYWIDTMHEPCESMLAIQMLSSMICEHRNSPSVIIWSIGNECIRISETEPQSNLGYFIKAAEFVHCNDPSRLAAYTSGMEDALNNNAAMECLYPKLLADKLDVIACNSYSGINDGIASENTFHQHFDKINILSRFEKPLILAEIGIDAVLGEKGFDFGEERQAVYHEKVMQLFKECIQNKSLQGLSVFALCDFRTPIKLGRYQQGYNRKGLLTEDFKQKRAYSIVSKGFSDVDRFCQCE